MAIIFIPTNDYSTSASDAATISEIDFGFIQAGSSVSRSFRLGNVGTTTAWSLSFPPQFSASIIGGTLQADEITDTITLTLSVPTDAISGAVFADIVAATPSGSESRLECVYDVVGANETRTPEFPDRASTFTDNVSNVIDRVSAPIRIHIYEPVPLSDDGRVLVEQGERGLTGDAGDVVFKSQCDVCERLNPVNTDWGYTHSARTIAANFQAENFTIRETFRKDDSVVTWTGGARLIIPAEYVLQRTWALFDASDKPDRQQFKRTVFVLCIQSKWWCAQNLITVRRGGELSYYSADLIPLHNANMGAPEFYNPFALTYRDGDDKPYAMYPCEFAFVELQPSGSITS